MSQKNAQKGQSGNNANNAVPDKGTRAAVKAAKESGVKSVLNLQNILDGSIFFLIEKELRDAGIPANVNLSINRGIVTALTADGLDLLQKKKESDSAKAVQYAAVAALRVYNGNDASMLLAQKALPSAAVPSKGQLKSLGFKPEAMTAPLGANVLDWFPGLTAASAAETARLSAASALLAGQVQVIAPVVVAQPVVAQPAAAPAAPSTP